MIAFCICSLGRNGLLIWLLLVSVLEYLLDTKEVSCNRTSRMVPHPPTESISKVFSATG